jgi:hypothetical protein
MAAEAWAEAYHDRKESSGRAGVSGQQQLEELLGRGLRHDRCFPFLLATFF